MPGSLVLIGGAPGIGKSTLTTMVLANLQDHFMGKLLGLPMGMAPCYTLHSQTILEGQQTASQLLTAAGANYFMDVGLNTDRMLAYFDTSAHDVQGVLAAAGYTVDSHDIVAPGVHAPVHDGSKIVLKRGRLLNLDVDGKQMSIWTTAQTVASALSQRVRRPARLGD